MLRYATIFVISLLIGCTPNNNLRNTISDPLTGYQIMDNPRSSVPLGAIWINNFGPNGNGIDATDIEQIRGIESYTYTSQINADMTAKLANMLGISGNIAKRVSLTLQGIEIYRVKDIFLSTAVAGENILYEAVKVQKITAESTSGGIAEISSQLQSKGIPFVIDIGGSGGQRASIDGSNLFIAFKVISFVQLDYGRNNVLIDGWATDFFMSTHGYQIKTDASSIHECACVQENEFRSCLEQEIKLKITEPSGMSIGGIPSEMTIEHKPSKDWDKNYLLWKRTETELPSGTVYRVRYLSLDLRRHLSLEKMPSECEVRVSPGASGGQIAEIYYELKPLFQPKGW